MTAPILIAAGAGTLLIVAAAISPVMAVLLIALALAVYVWMPRPTPMPRCKGVEDTTVEVYPVTAPPLEPATTTMSTPCDLTLEPTEAPVGFPEARNRVDSMVLGDEPFPHPGKVDRLRDQLWFHNKSPWEKQQEEMKLHRSMRRSQEWGAVSRWTDEDKAKYERARRALEATVAKSLRPDRYTIMQRDPEADYSSTTDQPFAAVLSNQDVLMAGHHRQGLAGSGDLASHLKSKI